MEPKEDKHKINEKIHYPKLRVVGEGIEPAVYTTNEALRLAQEKDLDLVVITEKADPPVAKIIDYKKKQKEIAAKAQKTVVKEIRYGPNTDEHDYEFKRKHAENFLQEGSKLKAYVFFKGRSIVFKDKGEILLLRLAQDLEEIGKVESLPKLEGKRMIMMIAPKKIN
jgi:translation initiation factor IF-3